jgi:hypothetical protein
MMEEEEGRTFLLSLLKSRAMRDRRRERERERGRPPATFIPELFYAAVVRKRRRRKAGAASDNCQSPFKNSFSLPPHLSILTLSLFHYLMETTTCQETPFGRRNISMMCVMAAAAAAAGEEKVEAAANNGFFGADAAIVVM